MSVRGFVRRMDRDIAILLALFIPFQLYPVSALVGKRALRSFV